MVDDVLVTGGAGFIGSHAAVYYDENGANVTVVDALSRGTSLSHEAERCDSASYNWEYLSNTHPDIELIEADVTNSDRIASIVEGHDAIVHTAGQVAVTESIRNPRSDLETNALGTLNVLEAARTATTQPAVAFTSTNKVYGDNVNDVPIYEKEQRYEYDDSSFDDGISESFPIDNAEHTPYGVSKLTGDLYVQDYARRGLVDAAAFRMSCIYGPRQFGTEEQGWLAHFVLSVLKDDPITVYGDGKQVRDVLYVDDLVRAFDAFLSDPADKPAVYNIGGGQQRSTSLLETLERLSEMTGRDPTVTYEGWREGDQRVYVTDITRVREVLDWEPEIDLETGIERYIDWYTDVNGAGSRV